MPDSALIEGSHALLFDRLRAAKSPVDPQFLRYGDRQALRESVRRELETLLNTRSPTPTHLFAERALTVIDYGLPDLSPFDPQAGADRGRLARLLSRAITAFEPRLRQVQVTVEPMGGKPHALFVQLRAALVVESFVEPVHFSVEIEGRGSQVQVLDRHPLRD